MPAFGLFIGAPPKSGISLLGIPIMRIIVFEGSILPLFMAIPEPGFEDFGAFKAFMTPT